MFIADNRWIVLVVLLALWLLLIAACSGEEPELTVELLEQEDSSQSGTAILKEKDAKTEIRIITTPGDPNNDPQPVHVHFGRCGAALGTVRYPLNDVVAGESTTLVDATLAAFREGNNAINIHLSYPEIRIYTTCGDISER